MGMNETYLNSVATSGGALITYIALVNGSGVEVSTARLAVAWTAANAGEINPTTDLTFDIGAGATVAGWSGFSALTEGTEYGGAALTPEVFASAGAV